MSDRIRVVLVDDDRAELACLQAQLQHCENIQAIGQFYSYEDAELQLTLLGPDVVLLDLNITGRMGGAEATKVIKKKWPRIKVIILTNSESDEDILGVLRSGADGYMVKLSTTRQALANAIVQAHRGDNPLSQQVTRVLLLYQQKLAALLPQLSPTERRIMILASEGMSRKQIAGKLKMSIDAVKMHVKRMCEKNAADSAVESAHRRRQMLFV